MTGRVLLGQRGGAYGLWVSKPGMNVLTATESQMMLSTERASLQILTSGVLSFPGIGGEVGVTIPDLGFNPMVIVNCASHIVGYYFASSTSLIIRGFGIKPSITWASGGSAPVVYAVTNQPLYNP